MENNLLEVLDKSRLCDKLLDFLYPDDAGNIVASCWRTHRGVIPRRQHLVTAALRKNGHDPARRHISWALHCRSAHRKIERLVTHAFELEERTRSWQECDVPDLSINTLGEHIMQHISFSNFKSVLMVGGEIDRDLLRTMPHHPAFRVPTDCILPNGTLKVESLPVSSNIAALRRALQLFALAQPHVCYCQGMNYVAAAMLLYVGQGKRSGQSPTTAAHTSAVDSKNSAQKPDFQTESVRNVVKIMVSMSVHLGLGDLWRPGLPRLRCLAWQLSHVLKQHTPQLHEHLARIGFHYEVLAAQWVLTLMSSVLPLDSLARLWDLFFVYGWKTMFRAIVCILKAVQDKMCEMDVGEISIFFRMWKDGVACSTPSEPAAAALLAEFPEFAFLWLPDEFVHRLLGVKITRSTLKEAENKYVQYILKKKVTADGMLDAPLLVPLELCTRRSPLLSTKSYISFKGSHSIAGTNVQHAADGLAVVTEASTQLLSPGLKQSSAGMSLTTTPFSSSVASRSVLTPSSTSRCVLTPSTSSIYGAMSPDRLSRTPMTGSHFRSRSTPIVIRALDLDSPRDDCNPLLLASSMTAGSLKTFSENEDVRDGAPASNLELSANVAAWLPSNSSHSGHSNDPYITRSYLMERLKLDHDVRCFLGAMLPEEKWPAVSSTVAAMNPAHTNTTPPRKRRAQSSFILPAAMPDAPSFLSAEYDKRFVHDVASAALLTPGRVLHTRSHSAQVYNPASLMSSKSILPLEPTLEEPKRRSRGTSVASDITSSKGDSPQEPARVSKAPYCPNRLDTDENFIFLFTDLTKDILEIDEAVRADALALNLKISAARVASHEARDLVAALAAEAKMLEKQTLSLLSSKQHAADAFHARLTSGASARTATTTMIEEAGNILTSLDTQVKDVGARWKKVMWDHTLAMTRASEMQSACDALMAQLIHVTNRAEVDKDSLCMQLWYALSRAWLRRRDRIHLSEMDLKYGL